MKILRNRHVLAVKSVETSSRYFQDILGFTETFAIGNDWRFLERDSCEVMMGECRDEVDAGETGNHSYFAFWTVDDAAGLHEEWEAKGVEICYPIRDEDWGWRAFGVRTPDGHRIMVGQQLG